RDEVAETAAADVRCQYGARDDLHCRGADSGEDHGQRERHFDLAPDFITRHPHSARRIDDFGLHLPHRRVSIDEDGREREQREGEKRRDESGAEHRHHKCQHGERRQRAPDVGAGYRDLRGALRSGEQDADRDCDRDRDAECRGRQRDIRDQRPEESLRMRENELPGFDEQRHVRGRYVARRRSQCSSRESPMSAMTASAQAVNAPVQIFGAWSLLIPLKISVPSPPAFTYAATTATLITVTVAIRSPATMTGSASGSSMRRRISPPLIPIPLAAS